MYILYNGLMREGRLALRGRPLDSGELLLAADQRDVAELVLAPAGGAQHPGVGRLRQHDAAAAVGRDLAPTPHRLLDAEVGRPQQRPPHLSEMVGRGVASTGSKCQRLGRRPHGVEKGLRRAWARARTYTLKANAYSEYVKAHWLCKVWNPDAWEPAVCTPHLVRALVVRAKLNILGRGGPSSRLQALRLLRAKLHCTRSAPSRHCLGRICQALHRYQYRRFEAMANGIGVAAEHA